MTKLLCNFCPRKHTTNFFSKYINLSYILLLLTALFCSISRLQVHYPPHVTLTSDKGELLEEGERVRFSCSASANPSQVSYAWYVGGRRVADAPDASTELVLDHVDRRLHNHLVKCEVTNPIGRSEQTAVLNIACKLLFSRVPCLACYYTLGQSCNTLFRKILRF